MLHFITLSSNRAPLNVFFNRWAPSLLPRIRFLAYEAIDAATEFSEGTYIFADLERLLREDLLHACAVRARLAGRPGIRVLNEPERVLPRFELLRCLHENGSNRFNVFWADEVADSLRFPVFLRAAHEHGGALSPLLRERAGLEAAISAQRAAMKNPRDLLVVEFLDTSSGGVFRKYAATRIAGRVLAHHVMFQREWEVKGPSLAEPRMIAEERRFQLVNPHRKQLAAIFAIAGIDFGRIDYAVAGGSLQVWEINTNPTLLYRPARYEKAQMPNKRRFAAKAKRAFIALDEGRTEQPLMERFLNLRDRFH